MRNLNRVLGKIMRNIAKKVAMEESYDPKLKSADIKEILEIFKI
ncbi:MAG: hypothetical protein R2771_12540 [Saprospiraceae bacterium]